jgi:hypothetical protein
MSTNKNHNDFTTVMNKDFYTVLFKGVVLFTMIPLQVASTKKQVTLNYGAAQEHIKSLKEGVSLITSAQKTYNELNSQKQF